VITHSGRQKVVMPLRVLVLKRAKLLNWLGCPNIRAVPAFSAFIWQTQSSQSVHIHKDAVAILSLFLFANPFSLYFDVL
jgi:hypothetical protein